MTQRKSTGGPSPALEGKVSVQLWVTPELREGYREAVKRQERSVAQALRHHMAEVVAQDDLQAAA